MAMPTRTKLRAAALGGSADDIENAFYEALQRGDIDALMACWADEDEVVCVHPGGPRLVGTTAIRAAFERMFEGGGHIDAKPTHVRRIEALAIWDHAKAVSALFRPSSGRRVAAWAGPCWRAVRTRAMRS